jgi:hypothetical protein
MAAPISDFSFNQIFRYEPGYVFIQSVCKEFFVSYHLFFFIISVISIGLYGILIWKYSAYPFLSVLIYICVFFVTREMIIIRYGCATSITLLALINFSDGKILKSIFWASVASLFHYTVLTFIIMFLLFFLFRKFNEIKIMETIIIISSIIALFGISIFKIGELIFNSNVLPQYLVYAFGKGMQYIGAQNSGINKRIVFYLPLIYFYKKCNTTMRLKGYYFIFLFSLFMLIEFTQAVELQRIGQLYIVIFLIFIPMLLLRVKRRYYQLLYSYIAIYVLYTFIRVSFLGESGSIVKW